MTTISEPVYFFFKTIIEGWIRLLSAKMARIILATDTKTLLNRTLLDLKSVAGVRHYQLSAGQKLGNQGLRLLHMMPKHLPSFSRLNIAKNEDQSRDSKTENVFDISISDIFSCFLNRLSKFCIFPRSVIFCKYVFRYCIFIHLTSLHPHCL